MLNGIKYNKETSIIDKNIENKLSKYFKEPLKKNLIK